MPEQTTEIELKSGELVDRARLIPPAPVHGHRSASPTPGTPRSRRAQMLEASRDAAALADEVLKLASVPHSFLTLQSSVQASNIGNATFLQVKDEADVAADRFGEDSWQAKSVHFVHSTYVQLVLSLLLMLDVFCVVVELFLEAHYPACHFIVRDAISCCPGNSYTFQSRRLGGHGHHHDLCGAGLMPNESYGTSCDDHKYDMVHLVHECCFFVTIVVLNIFLAELMVLFAALRSQFLKKPWYVLDLVIVVGTLTLEYCHCFELLSEFDPAKIMILARCWRFVRIGHGLIAEAHEHGEKEVAHIRTHCQELLTKLRNMNVQFQEVTAQSPSHKNKTKTPTHLRLDQPLGHESSLDKANPASPGMVRHISLDKNPSGKETASEMAKSSQDHMKCIDDINSTAEDHQFCRKVSWADDAGKDLTTVAAGKASEEAAPAA